jgi:hypothetical protein
MDYVIYVLKKCKGLVKKYKKSNKRHYLSVIVAIKEQENSFKRCAILALNNLNKQIAKCVEWNVLTTKRFVICAVFIMLSIQIILTKEIKSKILVTL